MPTKDDILVLLRRQPLTISELARELSLTRNAVMTQVTQLLSEQMIKKGKLRRAARAGKPAHEFEAMPGREDAASRAYLPFVQSLLTILPDYMEEHERTAFLEKAGRHMAREAGLSSSQNERGDDFEARLEIALGVVNTLGADARIEKNGNGVMVVTNVSCPLASAVRCEACVCQAVAAFFTEATGKKIKANCQHGEKLVCKYLLSS